MGSVFESRFKKAFKGTSGDVKPTVNIPNGSTFEEADTGKVYYYDGSSWLLRPDGSTGSIGDTAATNSTGPWSMIAMLKGIFNKLGSVVLAAGTATIGAVFIVGSSVTNGCTNQVIVSAASNNAAVIKASAGRIVSLALCNTSAAVKYVKLYNKATAPTVGTDTPVQVFEVPAGGVSNLVLPAGIYFATGIGIGIVGGAAHTDNTAVALNDVIVNLQFV